MQIRTDKDCCPACGRDRLSFGAGIDRGNASKEYPCFCAACNWQGSEWYQDNYFIGHTSAAGVVAGY